MSDFDHIKSLLAPQCPQLSSDELDDLTSDIFTIIGWADLAKGAISVHVMGLPPAPPACEQLCQ